MGDVERPQRMVQNETSYGKTSPGKEARLRSVVQSFSAQYFLIPQGTGIIGVILHQLNYQFNGLHIISYIFWVLAIATLLLFLIIYAVRFCVLPRATLDTLVSSPTEMYGLASISITFTSILQMASISITSTWRGGWPSALLGLWWFNVGLAFLSTTVITFFTVRAYPHGIKNLPPTSHLPLIAALTVAAGGGTICGYAIPGPDHTASQAPVIIVSYLFIGMALPIALVEDSLFLMRATDRGIGEATENVYTDMILCGPWGQASFALQGLGSAVLKGGLVGPQGPGGGGMWMVPAMKEPVGFLSIFAGLMSWGVGTFWWTFALLSIAWAWARSRKDDGVRKAVSFGIPTWSIIFPWVSLYPEFRFASRLESIH